MAVISSSVLISSVSLIHLTVAYFLYTAPVSVTRHGMVLVLGSAFELPIPNTLVAPSTATSWLACFFAFIGSMDFFSANLDHNTAVHFWASQAPLRTFWFFALAAWGWLGGPKGLAQLNDGKRPALVPGSMSDGLIFAWAFIELVVWFWVFLTVRDERRAAAMKTRPTERD